MSLLRVLVVLGVKLREFGLVFTVLVGGKGLGRVRVRVS